MATYSCPECRAGVGRDDPVCNACGYEFPQKVKSSGSAGYWALGFAVIAMLFVVRYGAEQRSDGRPADPLDYWLFSRFIDEKTNTTWMGRSDLRNVRVQNGQMCGEMRTRYTPRFANRFDIDLTVDYLNTWYPFIYDPAKKQVYTPDLDWAELLCPWIRPEKDNDMEADNAPESKG